jgi:hypothetical protein
MKLISPIFHKQLLFYKNIIWLTVLDSYEITFLIVNFTSRGNFGYKLLHRNFVTKIQIVLVFNYKFNINYNYDLN